MQRLSFTSLSQTTFDIIIVGGGITGATLAHQAAAQGLRVVLFEKNDFGSATSAATSKLIHGGLRYLKNLEFSLVRQSLRERRILGSIASNLVQPLRFIIPHYRSRLTSKLTLKAGLCLYDLLSFDKKKGLDAKNVLPNHRTISADQVLEVAPILSETGLDCGVAFYDYSNVNPDRLTLAFLKSAQDNGACLANYTKVESLDRQDNRIVGVTIVDQLTQAVYSARATWLVNCAGAWVDEILHLSDGQQSSHRLRSEGVHLITSKFTCSSAIVIQTSSGQHLMFLPWRGVTIVGPTDRGYHGHPSDYKPSRASLDELIASINAHVPPEKMGGAFTRQDVLFHYGGLRPLVDAASANETYSASRRHEIVDHQKRDGLHGLISVEGGKYTTSRGLAEAVLRLVGQKSQWKVNRVDTTRTPLHGCTTGKFAVMLDSLIQRYENHYSRETIQYYANNYGLEAGEVLEMGMHLPDGKQVLTADGEIMAEVDHALQEEMAYTLGDLLLRRTGVGWMGRPKDEVIGAVAAKLGSRLGWTSDQQQKAIEQFIEATYTLP